MTFSIPAWLRLHPTPAGRKSDGGSLYHCPVCRGQKKLEVSADRTKWFCHKCGQGGRLKGRMMIHTEERQEREIDLTGYHPVEERDPWWRYLTGRGLGVEHLVSLRPHTGPNVNYVYFPVTEYPDHTLFYVGRSINQTEPKYLFPRINVKEHVWGINHMRARTPLLVLCEGILDAVWSDNRVALFGKSLSLDQITLINKHRPREVALMFDPDAVEMAAIQARNLSRHYTGRISIVDLPDHRDPGELGEEGEQWVKRRRRLV